MNITFIGMAGAGKSTIGAALAENLNYNFVDTDQIIESKTGKKLPELIQEIGEANFSKMEGEEIIALGNNEKMIISTGGSIIYNEEAMNYLKSSSKIIFLEVSFEEIKKRLDSSPRKLIGLKGKTLKELYEERKLLYCKYADVVIEPKGMTVDEVVNILKDYLVIL